MNPLILYLNLSIAIPHTAIERLVEGSWLRVKPDGCHAAGPHLQDEERRSINVNWVL